jgi:hypothetical protein
MHSSLALVALIASQASAYPWVSDITGINPRDIDRRVALETRQTPGSAATCPNNPVHKGAVPISTKYPYCGAIGGVPGKQSCPNNLVPASVS